MNTRLVGSEMCIRDRTQTIANIRNENISTVPKYKTICVYHGKNKNTARPQTSPLTHDVDIAADKALAASPLRDIGKPSTIVAAAPPAPGIFITTPQKLSPILEVTTIAVVNTTNIYGSWKNVTKLYIAISPVVAPATGIRPTKKP